MERAKSRLEKTVVLQVVQMRRSRERSLGGFSERGLVVVVVGVLGPASTEGSVSIGFDNWEWAGGRTG